MIPEDVSRTDVRSLFREQERGQVQLLEISLSTGIQWPDEVGSRSDSEHRCRRRACRSSEAKALEVVPQGAGSAQQLVQVQVSSMTEEKGRSDARMQAEQQSVPDMAALGRPGDEYTSQSCLERGSDSVLAHGNSFAPRDCSMGKHKISL